MMKLSWLLLLLAGLWQIQPTVPADKLIDHPTISALIDAQNAEIFQTVTLHRFHVDGVNVCAEGGCEQVYIYDFAHDATVVALLADGRLIDARRIENATPAFNQQILRMAQTLIAESEMVQEAVGGMRNSAEIVIMQMQHPACPSDHLCVATTLPTDGGSVWVLVDVTREEIVDLWWTDVIVDSQQGAMHSEERDTFDCDPHTMTRDGWSLEYRITPSDGFAVADVYFEGKQVLHDVRLIQWEANYVNDGNYGYIDYTGCGADGEGHGFPINPVGATEINTIEGGFELRQNFEMVQWGAYCNYRYEQSYAFYADGRWRVIGRPYGRGCGDSRYKEATYRPVFRIDFALDGVGDDYFQAWNGSQWQSYNHEAYFSPTTPSNADGRAFRIFGSNGVGYEMEMATGQFGDGGQGDNGYTYVTRSQIEEGEFDLPTIGECCHQDHQKPPLKFVDGETIAGVHLTMWYVPEALTQTKFAFEQGHAAAPSCWTESATEFYPCPMGPMFHPIENPLAVGLISAETHQSAPLFITITVVFIILTCLWLGKTIKLSRLSGR